LFVNKYVELLFRDSIWISTVNFPRIWVYQCYTNWSAISIGYNW